MRDPVQSSHLKKKEAERMNRVREIAEFKLTRDLEDELQEWSFLQLKFCNRRNGLDQ